MRSKRIFLLIAGLLLASFACRLVSEAPFPPTPGPAAVTVPVELPTASATVTATSTPSRINPRPTIPGPPSPGTTSTPHSSPEATQPAACTYDPHLGSILEQATAEQWIDWIEKLSGAEPVVIDGEEVLIETRYTPAMFAGQPNARAFEYVEQTVRAWYPQDQVTVMDYTVERESDHQEFTWQNLVLTLPGQTRPDEIVILSAHLDSMSDEPQESAPGAEDNGSGSAALLEAARVLRGASFERTIQIIWFTGEELGLHGSRAYVKQIDDPEQVVGVVNLDMFGYDSDNDRCFEMHVGTLPASDQVGRCFTGAIEAYDLDLPLYDYLEAQATDRSDHGSFWERQIGAIEILENMFDNELREEGQPRACPNGDPNPDYHTQNDTADRLNSETGIQITRAAIATIASMAGLVD